MEPVIAPRRPDASRSAHFAAVIALLAIPTAVLMAFFYAPTGTIAIDGGENIRDFPQKIFYIHVPIALTAYFAFFVGAWNAVLFLWKGESRFDTRSYVGVHVGVVFGTLVLVTGSLWARAAWGVWWQWADRQLLVFLVLYLYYITYFMIRFSIDESAYRQRISAVCAVLGAALVPISAGAVRISESLIHPTVVTKEGVHMTGEMTATVLVSLAGFIALAVWMMQVETTTKLVAEEQRVH